MHRAAVGDLEQPGSLGVVERAGQPDLPVDVLDGAGPSHRVGTVVGVAASIRDGKPLDDPKLAALRDFTSEVVATRGRPAAEELDRFLSVGYTETQVLEIVLAVAIKTISNFTNHLLETPLDDVFAGRSWLPD